MRPWTTFVLASISAGILPACFTPEPMREVDSATLTFDVGAGRARECVAALNELLEASREAARWRSGCALYPPERLPVRDARETWFEARGDDVVVMRMESADECEVDAVRALLQRLVAEPADGS